MGELELGNKLPSLNAVGDSFEYIAAQNYEKVAGEILHRYQDRIFIFHKAGRWWDKNEEIDIVAFNETTNEILEWAGKIL